MNALFIYLWLLKFCLIFLLQCLLELLKEAAFMYTSELENMVSACFRALDGSNYDVRSAVAKLLGVLLAMTQSNPPKGESIKLAVDNVASFL